MLYLMPWFITFSCVWLPAWLSFICFSKSRRRRRRVQLRMTWQRRSYQHQDQRTAMMKIPWYGPTASVIPWLYYHMHSGIYNKVFLISILFYAEPCIPSAWQFLMVM